MRCWSPKGYEVARSANADEIAVFASASETFNRRNINCSIAESFERSARARMSAKIFDANEACELGMLSCAGRRPTLTQRSSRDPAALSLRLSASRRRRQGACAPT